MQQDDLSFLNTDDPDSLSPENRERYIDYWFSRTPEERLKEVWRLNVAKYGIKPGDRMDKTKFEVINRSKYRYEKNQ